MLDRRALLQALGSAALLPAWQAAAQTGAPVKVGFHAGLTGPAAADGLSAEIAVKLAFEEVNTAGGVDGRQIQLVVYDDQGKPEQAVPIANRLIGDGVAAVISAGFSAPTKAAAPVFQDAKIPYLVAIALQPDITKAGPFVFRVGSMGEVEGRAGAKLVGERLSPKSVVLLTIKTDFGKTVSVGFKSAAERFGFKVAKEYEYSPGDRQFGSLIASLKADRPDVIYATGFYFTGAPLVSQIRSAGIEAPFVGAQSYSSTKFIDIAGKAANGVLITNVLDWTAPTEVERSFIASFEKRAGFRPEAVATQAFACAEVLTSALRGGGLAGPERLRDALAASKIRTAAGLISFNGLHEVQRAFPVSVVRDGRWEAAGTIDDPVLLAPPTQ